MQWGLRLENILKQCVQNGASILFTITYGTCKIGDFSSMLRKCSAQLCSFSPLEDWTTPDLTEELSLETPMNYGLRCVYAPLSVYHFFIRIGFDEVMEQKLERRLQTPNNEYKVVFLGFWWAGDPPFHAPAVSFKAYALCGHFEYA